jgi:hypothetical protein
VRLGANIHAPGDVAEIIAMEKIALEDEKVKEAIKKLELPEGSVIISDPWIYGMDFSSLTKISLIRTKQDRMELVMMKGCTSASFTCRTPTTQTNQTAIIMPCLCQCRRS